jgi:hypothetical protein
MEKKMMKEEKINTRRKGKIIYLTDNSMESISTITISSKIITNSISSTSKSSS